MKFFMVLFFCWSISAMSMERAAPTQSDAPSCREVMAPATVDGASLLDEILARPLNSETVNVHVQCPELKPFEEGDILKCLIAKTRSNGLKSLLAGGIPSLEIEIVLPPGYSRAQLSVPKEQLEALKKVLAEVEVLRGHMNALGLTTSAGISWLAEQWDLTSNENEKASIMTLLMQNFKLSNEDEYIELIASSSRSKEFKRTLADLLAERFESDPSWMKPLKKAKAKAGI